jgi:hypothetical protein
MTTSYALIAAFLLALGVWDLEHGGVLLSWRLRNEKPVQKVKFKGHIHRIAWATGDRLLTAGFEAVQLWSSAAFIAPEESKS